MGSSNLSRSALETGIEWNLRVERDRDQRRTPCTSRVRGTVASRTAPRLRVDSGVREARTRAVHTCSQRANRRPSHSPLLRQPTSSSRKRSRSLGRHGTKAGAAHWSCSRRASVRHGSRRSTIGNSARRWARRHPACSVLAHRKELLTQAAQTFQRALRSAGQHARVGWCLADESDLSAERSSSRLSPSSLGRSTSRELAAQRFDYVVVDEVHHAAAKSYRDILHTLDRDPTMAPRFILGLTATPDRADSATSSASSTTSRPTRAGIDRGVETGRLVPFHVLRGEGRHRLRQHSLEKPPLRPRRRWRTSAQTEARMVTLWRAWERARRHPNACLLLQHRARELRPGLASRAGRSCARRSTSEPGLGRP